MCSKFKSNFQGNPGLMPAVAGSSKPMVSLAASGDLSNNPIYTCSSLPESRAKTLCRKHPGRMLDLTETQVMSTTYKCTFFNIRCKVVVFYKNLDIILLIFWVLSTYIVIR